MKIISVHEAVVTCCCSNCPAVFKYIVPDAELAKWWEKDKLCLECIKTEGDKYGQLAN